MLKIELTQNYTALIDDEDLEKVSQYNWCVSKDKNTEYAITTIKYNNKQYTVSMHRLIMDAKVGEEIDHINGNGLDNRKENLRVCTHTQNNQNRQKIRGKSKYKGVGWDKQYQKWRPAIRVNKVLVNLGRFDNEEDAARAYDKAAQEYFEEFAYLNFQDS